MLRKNREFIERQKHFAGGYDSSDEDENNQEEGIYLLRRKDYTKKVIPDVLMQEEQQYLFEREEPLIEFNGRDGKKLDIAVAEVLRRNSVTVPVLHVKDNKYFLGTSVEKLILNGQN